tara:strand:- start:6 stop:473 length:468 start_codon:yes stop_codon:yes gene_type:complete
MADVKDLQPYAANIAGLVAILEDFRQTMPNPIVFKVVGYQAEAFENIAQGDAVYSRASDGKVGKAVANATADEATVAGFAETTKSAGQSVRVIVSGQVPSGQTLDAGDLFFLSGSSAGSITKTPPTTAGQFLTFVGEAANSSELIVRIKRAIRLG